MENNHKFIHTDANNEDEFNGQQNNKSQNNSNTTKEISEHKYAGFWMRFWAYLLDLIVIASIVRILVNPVFRYFDISLSSSSSTIKLFAPITIASAIIFYGYFVLMTLYFKQTIGKMVFGLKVISINDEKLTWGTVLFREWIGRFISVTTWIGYAICAFLPKKQGIHDLFSDTTVVHER